VVGMVHARQFSIVNVDVSIVAEQPMLAPQVSDMRRRLGAALHLPQDSVSVKPKTNEGMGFVGRGEGIAAFAVVLLASADDRC
jgi:2-C-methyl-D-erythritol 2,4-cyclodiphosphate synthase